MKLLFVLLVLIFTFSNLDFSISAPIPTPTPTKEYLISIKNFQYDVVGCRNHESSEHHGSNSNSGITGSSSSFEVNNGMIETIDHRFELGTIDGGGGPSSTAESSEESLCDNSELVRETFAVLDKCVPIDQEYYIFSIMYNNGTIRVSKYIDGICSKEPYAVSFVQPFDCIEGCYTNPKLYSIIEPSEIVIPKNTVVYVTFFGDCYQSWKKDFSVIDYKILNSCITTGPSDSEIISCNSTKVLSSLSQKINCGVVDAEIYTDVGDTECYWYNNDENQRTICYI